MEERNIDRIRRHFEDKNAQKRVYEDITRAREDATVTIGRAAKLFGFSESQLRDWENRGLLNPRRSKDDRGQRQYALSELDKLAIIKELMVSGYSLGNISPYIDEIWNLISYSSNKQGQSFIENEVQSEQVSSQRHTIDSRVEEANKENFWQYYVSQTLRIALNLICEDIPETIAGIIIPLKRKENALKDWEAGEVSKLGPCLIGWRDQDRTFHTFYEEELFFAFPSDFRVRGLYATEEENEPKDRTFVVIQRKARPLQLPLDVVVAVRRLLNPIYDSIEIWLPCFINGSRDIVYTTNVLRGINNPDSLLTFLANQVIHLGGKNAEGKDNWKFCCILLPRNPDALLQMRTLVVQAQSERSPHTINKTSVSPEAPILSLSLRAFLSIHVLFRAQISEQDTTIVFREEEAQDGAINSALAMPIGGEEGPPLGVLYIVSEQTEAFGKEYQHFLRLMGRILEELLLIVQVRQLSEDRLRDIIARPRVVNRTLAGYDSENKGNDSENKFIVDVEELLRDIRDTNNPCISGVTSFISVDIDDLTSLVFKYGDQMSINLSKVLGERIQDQVRLFFSKKTSYQIYNAYSDRFYIRLIDTTLEQARETAEKLRQVLKGSYSVPLTPKSVDRPKDRIELENVTVRLGVTSYMHEKLYDLIGRNAKQTQIADVRAIILNSLDVALNMGKQQGGDCIFSYYPKEPPEYEHGRMALWRPSKVEQ